MKLLLDTHTFLWLVEGSPNLSVATQTALADSRNDLYLSVASVWEMAIKIGSGKLTLTDALDAYVAKWITTYLIDIVPIRSTHAFAVVGLPDHHRDPFDRMLIAQSQVENMTLVTADSKFAAYGVPLLW